MPIKDIDCGMNYVCSLNQNGEVYSWGCNTFKQLGYELPKGKKKSPDDDFGKIPRRIDYFVENGI